MSDAEKTTTFDRAKIEDAVESYVASKLENGGVPMFPSRTHGVVAMERLDQYDAPKVDWDEFAAAMEAETGLKVVCVAHCEWQFDDQCDEPATLIAFDTPDLDPEYRDYYRNELTGEVPAPAPGA
jgi:hypothetical protein